MCFNYKVSLFTFTIGTIFSIILYKYGNKKYNMENKTTGIYLIFISLVQFMDFLLWIDINNKYGINKITTILGPILIICQPLIFYLIKYFYYKPDIFTLKNYNLPVAMFNLLYFIYFIFAYINFLTKDKLITSVKNNHLAWPWVKYYSLSYFPLLIINIFYLFDFKYALVLWIVSFFFLLISTLYFNYNVGEIWCFFGSFIPLIIYFLSFYIDKIVPFLDLDLDLDLDILFTTFSFETLIAII